MVEILLVTLLVSPLSARFYAKRATSGYLSGAGQCLDTSDISSVTWKDIRLQSHPVRVKFSIAESSENGNSSLELRASGRLLGSDPYTEYSRCCGRCGEPILSSETR